MENSKMTTDQLLLVIDLFRFLRLCTRDMSFSPALVVKVPAAENPRGFNGHTISFANSRMTNDVALCGITWVGTGSIARSLLSNREALLKDIPQFRWEVSAVTVGIVKSMGFNDDTMSRVREFFEEVKVGRVTAQLLKGEEQRITRDEEVMATDLWQYEFL